MVHFLDAAVADLAVMGTGRSCVCTLEAPVVAKSCDCLPSGTLLLQH